MTEKEHAEISRRLALAIGHDRKAVQTMNTPSDPRVVVWVGTGFRVFDYRYPTVIWPIAERFNCFPMQKMDDTWDATIRQYMNCEKYESAALAVAMAVIAAKEKA